MNTQIAIPANAKQFTKDLRLKPGFELWGTVTGRGFPYHRQWWIKDPSGHVYRLDQGCYSDSASALKSRRHWAFKLGALA